MHVDQLVAIDAHVSEPVSEFLGQPADSFLPQSAERLDNSPDFTASSPRKSLSGQSAPLASPVSKTADISPEVCFQNSPKRFSRSPLRRYSVREKKPADRLD